MPKDQPEIDLSPKVTDEVRKTTCYMCACRCGINVHMKDGKVAYIEGNNDHPVNQGVLCAKGSAGIMQHNAPSRLNAPMKRVGPRGSGEFEEITWEEAMIATKVLNRSAKTPQKSSPSLQAATSRKPSRRSGRRGSAHQTMPHTAASAR